MIAGGTFCLWGHWEGFQAQRSASWPSVDGTVVSSMVRSKSSGSGTNRGTTYEAEVRYQYQVDGAAYENDVQRFGQISMGWKSGAQADVRRHSRGPDTVYYDSAKPATSVLEPGLHWALCLKPAVGSRQSAPCSLQSEL